MKNPLISLILLGLALIIHNNWVMANYKNNFLIAQELSVEKLAGFSLRDRLYRNEMKNDSNRNFY